MRVWPIALTVFVAITVWASNAEVPQQNTSVYSAVAFFASIVVGVLGWLLKFLLTRDREEVDRKMTDLNESIDGLGVKVERIADTVAERLDGQMEELRRHDRDLFAKWDILNREFGQLVGEHHQTMRSSKRNNGHD